MALVQRFFQPLVLYDRHIIRHALYLLAYRVLALAPSTHERNHIILQLRQSRSLVGSLPEEGYSCVPTATHILRSNALFTDRPYSTKGSAASKHRER